MSGASPSIDDIRAAVDELSQLVQAVIALIPGQVTVTTIDPADQQTLQAILAQIDADQQNILAVLPAAPAVEAPAETPAAPADPAIVPGT